MFTLIQVSDEGVVKKETVHISQSYDSYVDVIYRALLCFTFEDDMSFLTLFALLGETSAYDMISKGKADVMYFPNKGIISRMAMVFTYSGNNKVSCISLVLKLLKSLIFSVINDGMKEKNVPPNLLYFYTNLFYFLIKDAKELPNSEAKAYQNLIINAENTYPSTYKKDIKDLTTKEFSIFCLFGVLSIACGIKDVDSEAYARDFFNIYRAYSFGYLI